MSSAYPITYRLAMVPVSPYFQYFCRSHGLFSYPTDLQGQGQGQGHDTLDKCPRTRSILCKNLVSLPLMVKSSEAKVVFCTHWPRDLINMQIRSRSSWYPFPQGGGSTYQIWLNLAQGLPSYKGKCSFGRTDGRTHGRTLVSTISPFRAYQPDGG